MKLDGCNALSRALLPASVANLPATPARTVRAQLFVARLADLRDELLNQNPNLDVHVRVVDLADKRKSRFLIDSLAHDKMSIF